MKPVKSPTKKMRLESKNGKVNLVSDVPIEISNALARVENEAKPVQLGSLGTWFETPKITNDAHYQDATSALKTVKGIIETVEKERKLLTAPLLDVKKRLDANAKVVSGPACELENHIKGLIIDFEDRRRQQLLREAEKRAARIEERSPQVADEIRAQAAIAVVTPDVAGVNFRRMKKARIVDLKALIKAVLAERAPLECVEANMTFLNAMARAATNGSPYDGVEFYEETIVAASSR